MFCCWKKRWMTLMFSQILPLGIVTSLHLFSQAFEKTTVSFVSWGFVPRKNDWTCKEHE